MKKTTAIVLSGGKGTRMGKKIPKQYLKLHNKPVLYYALKAFEDSFIDEIILVAEDEWKDYCRKEIIEKYGLTKVTQIVSAGKERYNSVYNALKSMDKSNMEFAGESLTEEISRESHYVFIHDGARPFLTQDIIERLYQEVQVSGACIAAVPAKDTIKIADEENTVIDTPRRDRVYQVQTPQTFSYPLVYAAYQKCIEEKEKQVTDDAMVVEKFTDHKIRLVMGSYKNIKLTTVEDLIMAENLL